MTDENTDALISVEDGDHLKVTTSEDKELWLQCTGYQQKHVRDPQQITEIWGWEFTSLDHDSLYVQIQQGLARFESQDFPYHSPLYDLDEQQSLGYIESLEVVETEMP